MVLPRSFYERDCVQVARDLLGKVLTLGPRSGRIVETEAYLGLTDPAAHAFRGITPRTKVIFGPAGHAYVYLSYGIHNCLNIVAEPEGHPGCVLIRALEPIVGMERDANGPGKLTQALGIQLSHNGCDVTQGPLRISGPAAPEAFEIGVSPRIGITRAADLPLRFFIRGNRHVSRARA